MIRFRDIRPEDEPFLREVYAGTRAAEMALLNWSDEQKAAFVHMQFNAQHQYYVSTFPAARFQIVLRNGEPVGRLYVDRRADEIRIIDVALLPACCGQGIGTLLIRGVQSEALATGRPVRIHVEVDNPAMRLYRRLGFRVIEDKGLYYLMESAGPNAVRVS